MAAEILFAIKGPNMESVEYQLNGGHEIPAALFINPYDREVSSNK